VTTGDSYTGSISQHRLSDEISTNTLEHFLIETATSG
jgi:hypothetical protein